MFCGLFYCIIRFMKNIRLYGQKPYSVAVIHGGPGAPGSMAPVANGLKEKYGVIEPLQSADSVDGQIRGTLQHSLMEYDAPFILIGHSWGAWLVWMLAAKYPKMVRHIILVGSGPFDEKYTCDMMKTRLENLADTEREKAEELLSKMNIAKLSEDEFSILGQLMSKSDAYCESNSLCTKKIRCLPCRIFMKASGRRRQALGEEASCLIWQMILNAK